MSDRGRGLSKICKAEELRRAARAARMDGGAREVQRVVIARRMLAIRS